MANYSLSCEQFLFFLKTYKHNNINNEFLPFKTCSTVDAGKKVSTQAKCDSCVAKRNQNVVLISIDSITREKVAYIVYEYVASQLDPYKGRKPRNVNCRLNIFRRAECQCI